MNTGESGEHMARIDTYGGELAERNHTVASLRAGKGSRKHSQASAESAEQAAAVAEAGIDMLSIVSQDVAMVRSVCPNTFITAALMLTDHPPTTTSSATASRRWRPGPMRSTRSEV